MKKCFWKKDKLKSRILVEIDKYHCYTLLLTKFCYFVIEFALFGKKKVEDTKCIRTWNGENKENNRIYWEKYGIQDWDGNFENKNAN